MSDDIIRPAWSGQFTPGVLQNFCLDGALGAITRAWAWGDGMPAAQPAGTGVKVAVIDSGIDAHHPALQGAVCQGVAVEYDERAENRVRFEADDPPSDLSGHGTACAGIIHALAPGAQIYSVRVLGRDMRGKALQFAGGLRWAIDHGMQVVNLSLSTAKEEYYGLFHRLADEAYFNKVLLVSAVNNIMTASYPSLYASVVSVAAHEGRDAEVFYYNAAPPVEFGAPGIDVEVAWLAGGYSIVTGNSFAAPHIAGMAARILSKHPGLTPFEVKTILMACANNRENA